MKYLFTLCLLVFTLSASAQWQQTGSRVRYVNGLGIPTRDTAAGVLADSSQIVIRPADSSLYVKYKRTWIRVGGGGGSIAGSGTTNYIPKFTSSTAIGNSQIFDNGTNVGIGTTSPGTVLQVGLLNTSTELLRLGVNYNTSNTQRGAITWHDNFGITGKIWTTYNGTNRTDMFFGGLYNVSYDQPANMTIMGSGNVGINQTAPAGRFVVADGQTLLGTNTNNGVDRLQVSGSIISSSTLKGGTNGVNGLVVNSGGATGAILNNIATSGSAGFDQIRLTFQHLGADRAYWYYSNTGGQLVTSTALTTNDIVFAPGNSSALYMKAGTQNVVISNSGTDNSVDKLQVNGSIQGTGFNQEYTAKTGTYTATTSDYFIDCTSGTFTVNLFTAVGNTGRILIIKNSGTGTITVDPNGTQTIDGATTQTLSTQWSRVHIISDGTNWKIISN